MEKWICKNCYAEFSQKYCGNCGQKRYTEKDKNLLAIFDEAVHFLTHFEGKFFRTMSVLLFRPGKFSVEYCYGIRQRYYKPVSFFLMLILLYLIFPFFEGLNMRMAFYPRLSFTGEYIQKVITDKMLSTGYSMEELSDMFRLKSEKVSKVLLLLLIPLTALHLK